MIILPISDIHGNFDIFEWIIKNKKNQFDVLTISGDIIEGKGVDRHMQFRDMLIKFHKQIGVPIILTQGNHDYWSLNLFNGCHDIHLLHNSSVEIDGIRFYGSPLSVPFFNWNWNVPEDVMYDVWYETIPNNVRVGLFHTPPFGFCDNVRQACNGNNAESRLGSTALRDMLHVKQIDYLFCGHIHTGDRHKIRKSIDTETNIFNVSCIDEKYQFNGFNPLPEVVEV